MNLYLDFHIVGYERRTIFYRLSSVGFCLFHVRTLTGLSVTFIFRPTDE
jgi:hypothetical protein